MSSPIQEIFNTVIRGGWYAPEYTGHVIPADCDKVVVANPFPENELFSPRRMGERVGSSEFMCVALKHAMFTGLIQPQDFLDAVEAIHDYIGVFVTIDETDTYTLNGTLTDAGELTIPYIQTTVTLVHLYKNWDSRPHTKEEIVAFFNNDVTVDVQNIFDIAISTGTYNPFSESGGEPAELEYGVANKHNHFVQVGDALHETPFMCFALTNLLLGDKINPIEYGVAKAAVRRYMEQLNEELVADFRASTLFMIYSACGIDVEYRNYGAAMDAFLDSVFRVWKHRPISPSQVRSRFRKFADECPKTTRKEV